MTAPAPVAPVDGTTDETVELIEQDLLVEDVSIDGMCGVYQPTDAAGLHGREVPRRPCRWKGSIRSVSRVPWSWA